MAKNLTQGSVGLISDLVDAAGQDQTLLQRKANTVTVTIGQVLTALAATGVYWIESGSDAPSWLPIVVFLVGQLATIFAVSQTRNGVTESVKAKLQAELLRAIDVHHEPTVEASYAEEHDPGALRAEADRLAGG